MKSVIAAYRDSEIANRAAAEVGASGIEPRAIRVFDEQSNGAEIMRTLVEHEVPRQRASQYAEGVRRGAVLVVADVADQDAPRFAGLLDRHGPIDLATAAERWTAEGWTGYREDAGMLDDQARRAERASFEHESLDVIEEEVRIGKREVAAGGVRVRSFVTERPIREALELREERIEVTREPVDEPLAATDERFTEEEFEVTARAEEPVVEKRARVVERVRVDKEVGTRTETIEDTERRRDVEVEVEVTEPAPTQPPGSEVRRH